MSSKQNIIYIYFKGKHLITSKSQYQYNHGQFLYFADLNLPQAFEVHFSNKDKGDSKTQIGSNKLVEIPDEYFWNGALMIYAWIYLHSETTDGETVYEVRIPLIKRAKPTDEEPLPQQQGTIDRAIAELNNAIEVTNENANKTEADKTIVANIKEDVINLKEDIDNTATTVSQKAQETINASERAEASAQNAVQYESNALNYSLQAEQSAQQALESKNIASQKAEVATNASSEALGYRDEALEAKNQAVQAKQNIVDYRDETKGYRDETLIIKNDVQTLKRQIDETAETVNTDAQSAEQSANSASQSASQAQEIADTLDNYLYATLSTDVNILALNGKKKTTKAESISVDVAAYKGDERLYVTSITGLPTIYRNYITGIAINYSMYKNNTYGFFRFAWNIENNWEIISDTTTSTITITAKDSEENVYTFEKPWTFLIVKDGDVGEDGFSVISLTNSFLIPTDENGIISDVTLLRADFRAYKGGTLINSKVLSAPAITLRDPNNPSVIRNKPWAKTSVASTTTYTSVTLERGYKIASGEHGTYSFTINADGKDVALSIPWIIVKKGDTGESGVYVGTEAPTDENVDVWIDSDGTADDIVTDVQVNGTSVVNNGIANITEIPTSLKYVKDDPSDNGGVVVGHVSENTASGWNAYAEGAGTRATGGQAHSEGGGTLASGNQAHAEGVSTIASGDNSHAENLATTASGACSHASGIGTIAQRKSQFVIGESNVADTGGSTTSDKGDYILIAGNGTSNSNRSNAMTLDWSGNEKLAGALTLGMNTQDETTISASELKGLKEMSPVDDVQINGASIVQDRVANVPVAVANSNTFGVVKVKGANGISINNSQELTINPANLNAIKAGTSTTYPVTVSHQHESAFYALAKASGDTTQSSSSNAVGTYTEDAKSKISEMLGGSVSVSGTTPTIVAKSGIRYVCGEVATLDFTPSATGICDVVFISGATATVLTVPSTIKWANGFDPTTLEANTTYEINIMDGLGVACAWT